MPVEIQCAGCKRRLRIRDEFLGRPVRCPGCGALWRPEEKIELEDEEEEIELVRADEDEEIQPVRADEEEEEAEADVPVTVEEEEQGITTRPGPRQRYGAAACPQCGAAMAAGAVVCLDCGYNRRTGRRHETVVKRLSRRRESEWPYALRLIMFAVWAIVGVLLFAILGTAISWGWFLLIAPWIVGAALYWGDWHAFEVERTRKGRLRFRNERYVAFIPLRGGTADAEDYAALVLDCTRRFSLAGCGMILLFLVTVPPLFMAYALNEYGAFSGRQAFRIYLRGRRPDEEFFLYRGTGEARMREIVEEIQKITDLPLERR
jgi:hypothetical protein